MNQSVIISEKILRQYRATANFLTQKSNAGEMEKKVARTVLSNLEKNYPGIDIIAATELNEWPPPTSDPYWTKVKEQERRDQNCQEEAAKKERETQTRQKAQETRYAEEVKRQTREKARQKCKMREARKAEARRYEEEELNKAKQHADEMVQQAKERMRSEREAREMESFLRREKREEWVNEMIRKVPEKMQFPIILFVSWFVILPINVLFIPCLIFAILVWLINI